MKPSSLNGGRYDHSLRKLINAPVSATIQSESGNVSRPSVKSATYPPVRQRDQLANETIKPMFSNATSSSPILAYHYDQMESSLVQLVNTRVKKYVRPSSRWETRSLQERDWHGNPYCKS